MLLNAAGPETKVGGSVEHRCLLESRQHSDAILCRLVNKSDTVFLPFTSQCYNMCRFLNVCLFYHLFFTLFNTEQEDATDECIISFRITNVSINLSIYIYLSVIYKLVYDGSESIVGGAKGPKSGTMKEHCSNKLNSIAKIHINERLD